MDLANWIAEKIWDVVAGLLYVIGLVIYIRSILRMKTKPSMATWIVWAVLDIVTLAGLYAQHKVNGQIVCAAIGASLTVVLTLKHGTSKWTLADKFCLAGALPGIVLLLFFHQLTACVVISSTVILLGSIPTVLSVWKSPSRENLWMWIMTCCSSVVLLASISPWTWAQVASPFAFFVPAVVISCILVFRSRAQRRRT